MSLLTLVGVSEKDALWGPERTTNLLETIKPDKISLSIPQHVYFEVVNLNNVFKRESEHVEEFAQQLHELHPEYDPNTVLLHILDQYFAEVAVAKYVRETSTRLIFPDFESVGYLPEPVPALLQEIPPGTDDLLRHTPGDLDSKVEEEYSRDSYPVEADETDLMLRDKASQKSIERESGYGINILHLGSLDQIFGDYHNLAERMKYQNPVRYKLNQFDASEIN